MKMYRKTLLLGASFGVMALAPTVAIAKPGYMTCQMTDSAKQRVFTTPTEFHADSADTDKAFAQYIALYQAEKIPYITNDLSHIQGICDWEAEKGVAMKKTTNYMIHFLQLGYLVHSDISMPDPFVP